MLQSPTKLDSHQWILDDVLEAMQNAEECGGPEGQSYIDLMRAIIGEATRRIDAHRSWFVGDDWRCECGNTPDTGGFQPCLRSGRMVEPTLEAWTDGDLYRCVRCDRIIAYDEGTDSGKLEGMTEPEFLGQTGPA